MSGKRNSLAKSTRDTKSIASNEPNNHHDMKESKTDYDKNEELLRKYIYPEVCHLQKYKSFSNNENDESNFCFVSFFFCSIRIIQHL